jgi:hypothetical protein
LPGPGGIAVTTNDDRTPTQFRSSTDLDRRQEGIHVDVQNPPGGSFRSCGHLSRLPEAPS